MNFSWIPFSRHRREEGKEESVLRPLGSLGNGWNLILERSYIQFCSKHTRNTVKPCPWGKEKKGRIHDIPCFPGKEKGVFFSAEYFALEMDVRPLPHVANADPFSFLLLLCGILQLLHRWIASHLSRATSLFPLLQREWCYAIISQLNKKIKKMIVVNHCFKSNSCHKGEKITRTRPYS